jgi:hypothetical protein
VTRLAISRFSAALPPSSQIGSSTAQNGLAFSRSNVDS